MSARAQTFTEDMLTNRVLYRLARERVLSRSQIHQVRGTNALIARMVELGWIVPAPALEPDADGVLRYRDRFEFTVAGHYAREERLANGNAATC